MRMHPYPMVVAIVLLLAACRPAATEWTESEAPNRLRLDDAAVSVKVRFAAGSAYLVPADAQRLRAMAAARRDAVSAALLPYGIVTSPLPLAGVPANQAVVQVGRYVVTLPPCPNWSKSAGTDFTNSFASNFACATQTNLGQMVASPADLVSGQPLGPAAGPPAVAAVQRYLSDKVKAPVSAASGGGGGGGGGSPGGSSDNTGSQ